MWRCRDRPVRRSASSCIRRLKRRTAGSTASIRTASSTRSPRGRLRLPAPSPRNKRLVPAAIRRKLGTDTEFPAQFAGNWLSVPGFAQRETLRWARCLLCVTLIFLKDMSPHQVLPALATFAAFSACCFGQAGKAELFGAIQDPQGLAAAQAKLTTEEQATGARFDVLTDDRGEYHLLGLAAGQYVLTVEKPGFRPYRQEGIALRIGDQIRLNVTLELGQASQSVEVNAQTSLLETAGGSVSYHVSQPQLETPPLDRSEE